MTVAELVQRWRCTEHDIASYALEKSLRLYYLPNKAKFRFGIHTENGQSIDWKNSREIKAAVPLSSLMVTDLFKKGCSENPFFAGGKRYTARMSDLPVIIKYEDIVVRTADVVEFERVHKNNKLSNNYAVKDAEAECVKLLLPLMQSPPTKNLGTNLPGDDDSTDCYRRDIRLELKKQKLHLTKNGYKKAVNAAFEQAGRPKGWCVRPSIKIR